MALLGQTETEQIIALLRKTLSGGVDKNLTNIVFETQQVVGSPEHMLLMKLRQSELKDDAAAQTLFETIIAALSIEGISNPPRQRPLRRTLPR